MVARTRRARTRSLTGTLLTEKESLFLARLAEGMTPAAAAAAAGYANPASTARALMLRPHIRDEVANIQARLHDELGVSRVKVLRMLNEAYQLALEKEDPKAIVRVAAEINKMCGYYQQGDQGGGQVIERLQRALDPDPVQGLPDEELMKLANGVPPDEEP